MRAANATSIQFLWQWSNCESAGSWSAPSHCSQTGAITWGTAAQLKVQIEKGAAFDVAVITDAGAGDLIKQGKLASRTALARSGIAVAIRKGAPKPDLRSVDDFKKMLLSAKSIAWVEQ